MQLIEPADLSEPESSWGLDELCVHLNERFAQILGSTSQDACRLFHGRGHCFTAMEHINIDFYSPVILITAYRSSGDNFEQQLANSLSLLGDSIAVEAVVIQRRYQTDNRLECLAGEMPQSVFACENGLRYALDFSGRQNVGFFLDMLTGRQWLAERAKGKRVLNLFAYTCAFSVVASSRGAKSVVNLDMSRSAIRTGQQNHQLNNLSGGVSYLAHELFRSWGKLRKRGPFDIIVVDPPSRQPGSFVAAKDYPRLLRRLPEVAAEGAELLICLNDPHVEVGVFRELIEECCPQLSYHYRLNNRSDFPEVDQNKSLKALFFTCDR